MADIHSHKCPKCSRIWTHDRDTIAMESLRVYQKAHTCAKCGTVQYYRHFESADAELSWLFQRLEAILNLED